MILLLFQLGGILHAIGGISPNEKFPYKHQLGGMIF
jgi:hypothetical protein